MNLFYECVNLNYCNTSFSTNKQNSDSNTTIDYNQKQIFPAISFKIGKSRLKCSKIYLMDFLLIYVLRSLLGPPEWEKHPIINHTIYFLFFSREMLFSSDVMHSILLPILNSNEPWAWILSWISLDCNQYINVFTNYCKTTLHILKIMFNEIFINALIIGIYVEHVFMFHDSRS